MRKLLLVGLFSALSFGCNDARMVRPLGEGPDLISQLQAKIPDINTEVLATAAVSKCGPLSRNLVETIRTLEKEGYRLCPGISYEKATVPPANPHYNVYYQLSNHEDGAHFAFHLFINVVVSEHTNGKGETYYCAGTTKVYNARDLVRDPKFPTTPPKDGPHGGSSTGG